MNPESPFGERYELRKPLWRDGPHGGWLAVDRVLGREVVVHVSYRADDDARFLQAAQLRARLRHANLIPLYDLGTTGDGRPFVTEPYIKATELGSLLDGSVNAAGATLPRFVSYLLDACEAVAFLHTNGFLHLDVHPGNVLVALESEEVFVVREYPSLSPVFVAGEEGGSASTGIPIVVPACLAPEQLDPEKLGTPDVATDVYGLGGILFEILYDAPPNGRRNAPFHEVLKTLAARKGRPQRGTLSARTAPYRELAQTLEPICLQAIEHDRTARQTSVSVFVNDIEQCVRWAV